MNRKTGLMSWLKGLMLKHVHSMITCREFESFVTDYLEGGLPPAQRRRFEWHLKLCRECRDYLQAYQTSLAIGKAAFESSSAPVPEDVPEDLVKAVLDARNR
jgi:anti-sigma factor RsiW